MQANAEKRREEIVAMVRAEGKVRVTELSKYYGISEVSVRKDLEILETEWCISGCCLYILPRHAICNALIAPSAESESERS